MQIVVPYFLQARTAGAFSAWSYLCTRRAGYQNVVRQGPCYEESDGGFVLAGRMFTCLIHALAKPTSTFL